MRGHQGHRIRFVESATSPQSVSVSVHSPLAGGLVGTKYQVSPIQDFLNDTHKTIRRKTLQPIEIPRGLFDLPDIGNYFAFRHDRPPVGFSLQPTASAALNARGVLTRLKHASNNAREGLLVGVAYNWDRAREASGESGHEPDGGSIS